MRDSILTMPITDVFEPKCGCPICRMRDMIEKTTVEYLMGEAMMDPGVRIATNKTGFCKEHYDMMLKEKNRLSLALMLQTHIDEVRKTAFNKVTMFDTKAAKSAKLSKINSSCFICDKVESIMNKMLKTMFELYQDEQFHKLFIEQEYICLPHCEMLKTVAPKFLPKKSLDAFEDDCNALSKKYLDSLYDDVSHYCKMYDYRNNKADWGNSKDSIERAIKFLTSR